MKKIYYAITLLIFFPLIAFSQTDPTPQSVPFSQNFLTFDGAQTVYPSGFQGWTIAGSTALTFPTAAPNGNQALAGGTNASAGSGVFDMNGKMGVLSTGAALRSIAFAINTTGLSSINISYTAATQRQETGARIGAIGLQYRIGTSGTFTDISGTEYQNPGGSNNTTGTGLINPQTISVVLPAACDNQANVQLRWVYREVSGAGNRPSFSVDDIVVSSSPSIQASAVAPGAISSTSINIFWTNGNGANRIVVARNNQLPELPVSGTAYTANSIFGSGSLIGANTYVVYNGSGNSVTVTGLLNNNQYSFQIFEYNGSGITSVYNVSTSSGNSINLLALDPAAERIRLSPSLTNSFTTIQGTPSAPQTLTLTGSNLSGLDIEIGSNNSAFELSLDGTTYAPNLTLTNGTAFPYSYSGGTLTATVFVRIQAFHPEGTVSGGVVSAYINGGIFSTTSTNVATSFVNANEPSTQASGISISGVLSNQFTVNWTSGSGANRLVVVRQGGDPVSPVDGVSYTANANFGSGSNLGSLSYVVYLGNSNTVTVTGLISTTSYTVAIYEVNGTGSTSNFNTSVTDGVNRISQTTGGPNVITTLGTVLTEAFNIGTSSTAALPTGWLMSPAGSTSPTWTDAGNFSATTQAASSGTPTAGGRYNWSITGDGNRAIGFMTSGGYASPNSIMARFTNGTGTTVNAISVNFAINRYRINTAPASIQFFYSLDGSTWTSVSAGNIPTTDIPTGTSTYTFSTPLVNTRTLSITGLTIPDGSQFYLRWNFNTGGTNSQGLGLDDVNITVQATAAAPTAQHNSLPSLSTTSSSATFSWAGGNGARTIVLLKAASAVDSNPVNGNGYTANSVFGSGSQLGTGNFVVFDGTGSSVTVTGLNSGTQYHLAIYTYNGNGLSSNYLTPAYTNNFTTPGLAPVTALTAAPITGTQATVDWTLPVNFAPASGTILVFAKEGSAITVGSPSLNSSSYTADANFTGTGTAYENDPAAKCVYNGDAASVTVTNLTSGNTYHYLVFHVSGGTLYSDSRASSAAQPTERIWIGASGQPWTTTTNWNPNGLPSAGEFIVINSSTTIATVPTVSIGALSIGTGATVTLQTPATNTLTVTASQNAVRIPSGASLTLSNNVSLTLASGSAARINGQLQLGNGSITRTGATLEFLNGSEFILNAEAGAIPTATWSSNSTVTITGYTTGTVAPSGLTQNFGNFVWNNPIQSVTVNLAGSLNSIAGYAAFNTGTGTLNLTTGASYTLNVGGDFTLAGGTVQLSSGAGAPTLNVGGNVTMNLANVILRGTTGSSTATINITGSMTMSGTSAQFEGATSSGGIINMSIGQDLTVAQGNFYGLGVANNPSTTSVITIGGKVAVGGGANPSNLFPNGSSNAASNIVFNIGGDLELNTNGTISSTATIAPVLNFFGGSTNAVILSGSGGLFVNNVNLSVGSGKIASLGRSIVLPDFTTFSVLNNGTLNTNNFTLSGGAIFNLNAEGTLIVTSTSGINSSGSTGNIQTTSRIFNSNARYIYSTSSNGSTGNALPSPVKFVGIDHPSDLTETAISGLRTISDTLYLRRGRFDNTNFNFNVANNGFVVRETGEIFPNQLAYAGQYNLTYAHTSGTVSIGDEFPNTLNILDTLVINHSGTEVFITGDRQVNARLRLQNGILNTFGSTLTLTPSTEIRGGSNASYVTGNLAHQNTTTPTNKLFPFGDLGIYRPISLTLAANVSVSTVTGALNFTAGAAYLYKTVTPPAVVSGLRFYEFANGSINTTLTGVSGFQVNADDNVANFGFNTNLRLAYGYDGNPSWFLRDLTAVPNTQTANLPITIASTAIVQGFTAFQNFGIVLASTIGDNPLPVELASFTAVSTIDGAKLNWRTASETENSGFLIFRDGVQLASFAEVASLKGKGTTSRASDYAFVDSTVQFGKTYTYQLKDVSFSGAIKEHSPITLTITVRARPKEFALGQNYPNPFNPATRIKYQLPVKSNVSIEVYDVLGKKVAILASGVKEAGYYEAILNGTNLSSGIYFYRIQAGGFVKTLKMLLVK
ncbi:MAG: T9SS type A sorting domain-containing protein [Chloroherpetonaceae bacterium]|nr:T9SS type A sorting domain-containing protein [Chloroherpetonaceae bacterium]